MNLDGSEHVVVDTDFHMVINDGYGIAKPVI